MLLEGINKPEDVKKLNKEELIKLAEEIREVIIKKVNKTGGHMGPNLGIVEATIAMHYVFNSPKDKIVFDVSHQCYPHKILTGRKEGFMNPEKYNEYSGYTDPEESPHDIFKVGHTSTSVSLATGLAKARDLLNQEYNVIALIGDGSLSGGEAFEGLNNASVLNSNIIIVVNDNDMSIAQNQGGLYNNLRLLRESKGKSECNFFKSLDFDYYYVEEGNNIEKLIDTFKKVKDKNHPVVVHIKTEKGLGLEIAQKNKEAFHWILPGTLDKKEEKKGEVIPIETYEGITTDYILDIASKDKRVIAVSPATPGAYGFTEGFRKKLANQYTDVGIAEEHAIAYCSALAKNGAKPILAILSSFIQRTYDQLSQDLCLNNSPVTILVFWGGISNGDATHLGSFDIPLISNIPNIVYLSPTNKQEYLSMLKWSIEENKSYPVVIRVPLGPVEDSSSSDVIISDYSRLNKFKIESKGEKVAILGLGNFFNLAKELKIKIKKYFSFESTLINPIYMTGLDKDLLEDLKKDHSLVITLEDGILDGGFGEKIARYYGNSDMKVLNYGGYKEFTDRVPLDQLYERYHLRSDLILNDIKCHIEKIEEKESCL